ncbi:hypothetical protein CRG98_003722 [Punica granatum]|uniref:Uncharacterized protein n=1 Tax=Punica granatum TaxID=22663 RepID=A0A2I0L5B9_PUNGR|nr:hypothetical protein CRG98_003722 [Punica granatum]
MSRPGLDFSLEASIITFQQCEQSGPETVTECTPDLYACHFVPRPWRVVPARSKGLGTFGATHKHLDPSLRSSTSPILHRAVVGASVPTPFSPSCRCCHLSHPVTCSFQPSLATLKAASPTLSLVHRGNGSDRDGRDSLGHGWATRTHGLVSRERPVSSLGLPGARTVSLFPETS